MFGSKPDSGSRIDANINFTAETPEKRRVYAESIALHISRVRRLRRWVSYLSVNYYESKLILPTRGIPRGFSILAFLPV
jgi:hypothetical protein